MWGRPCLDPYRTLLFHNYFVSGRRHPIVPVALCLVVWFWPARGRVGLITHWTNINQGRAGGDLWNVPASDTILTCLDPSCEGRGGGKSIGLGMRVRTRTREKEWEGREWGWEWERGIITEFWKPDIFEDIFTYLALWWSKWSIN